MKKIIVFSLLLILSAATFSQQIIPTPAINTDLMQKAMHQRHAANILFWCGPVVVITGAFIALASDNYLILIAGFVSMATSIPLFVAYHINKKKAMNASAYFKMEPAAQLQGSNFTTKPVPSLTLKIGL